MFKKIVFALILVVSVLLSSAAPTRADGIIIPDPIRPCVPMPCPGPGPVMQQLIIKYHHVTVNIIDQVAVTRVDQVFRNPNSWTVEGIYTFPIPSDAVVTNFKLWMDGKPVEGKVLDANAARSEYEEIVRQMRDPALLEYVGRGAVMARIYPIAPDEERRIELEYTQVLTADNGLIGYRYPLNTEKFSLQPLEDVSVTVNIHSKDPILSVYSPSHNTSVTRTSDSEWVAGYEAANVTPDQDYLLFYTIGQEEGIHLLTYRDPTNVADPDGFFLMLINPPLARTDEIIAKNLILVLDHSGSMEGEKFRQVQAAAHFILRRLNTGDHFNLIGFSSAVEMYSTFLQPADKSPLGEAWIDQMAPGGSTNIQDALQTALKMNDGERPTYVIFLTDGLPTSGETDSTRIIENIKEYTRSGMKLFTFGVGYDVDTVLLDHLAQNHHGSSTYVPPGQDAEAAISSFYQKISAPSLTDLAIRVDGISTYDLHPNPLPDLFFGSQIIVTGRYRNSGAADITLTGHDGITNYQKTFTGLEFTSGGEDTSSNESYIARLWANRKIGALLNQARLEGANQELIQQIVALSIRFGIVTPYTSYLVTETDTLGAAAQERIAQQQYSAQVAQPTQVSGEGAVNKAADAGSMSAAENLGATGRGGGGGSPAVPGASDVVKSAGSRTFVLHDGVWVDTRFDPDTMKPVQVKFLSKEYFALVTRSADMAAGLALGGRVILVVGDVVYEIVD